MVGRRGRREAQERREERIRTDHVRPRSIVRGPHARKPIRENPEAPIWCPDTRTCNSLPRVHFVPTGGRGTDRQSFAPKLPPKNERDGTNDTEEFLASLKGVSRMIVMGHSLHTRHAPPRSSIIPNESTVAQRDYHRPTLEGGIDKTGIGSRKTLTIPTSNRIRPGSPFSSLVWTA